MANAKYKRGKDGYFETRIWDGGWTPDGKKHRAVLRSRKSSADLERMVGELKAQVAAGKAVRGTDQTVMQYAEKWLQTKNVYERNTRRQYSDILNYYFRPVLSDVYLKDLSKLHLQMLISNSADHPRTCQLIRRTFLQIVNSAIDDRYLPETVLRSVKTVEIPKYRKKERRILTDLEKKAILAADLKPMHRCFVNLLYYCGLRRGEALGMTVADIDLGRQEARVCRSVELINNSSAIKAPKSYRGVRTVPLAPQMTEFLRGYLPTLESDYLIHNRNGGIMTLSSFRRMWEQIMAKLNETAGGTKQVKAIFGLTPHIFRHNFCSMLCYQIPAISTKKVAQILGDDESMVIQVYSHILEEKEDAPAALARAFSG